MASTIIIYVGDGTRTDFTVPFDYLKKSFVTVRLGDGTTLTGGDYGDTDSDYYFLDKTTIRLKVAPSSGESLTIRRYTSATERVVTFKDASILKATDLDTSQVQAFHIAEEGRDILEDSLSVNRDGNWDAKGKRIINVGTPVADSDAVTYGVYKTDALGAYQSKLDAERASDRAILAETNSKNYAINSKRSEDNAKLSEVNAQASAGTAVSASKHADAVKVENQAILQEAKEIRDENKILDESTKENATVAQVKADEARASAEKAKQSEVNSKESEVNSKESEKVVVGIANTIVPIVPEIKIVADNIDHVVTDSKSIDKINIVGTDLTGTLYDSIYDDYGDLGNPEAPMPVIVGGNIKIVADNIEDVKTVAGLASDFQIAISSVDTVTKLTKRAEDASKKAEASATASGRSETNAMASEVSASDSAGLAKDWANKMDGTVDGTEYSAKYYANRAKTDGGQAVEQALAKAVTQIQAEGSSQVSLISTEGTKQVNLARDQVTKATSQANTATAQARIATQKATEAESDADASHQYALQADASAKNATNSASSANTSATTASQAATEARTSADTAALHKDAAQKAASDAQAALVNKLDKSVFDGFVDYGDLSNK